MTSNHYRHAPHPGSSAALIAAVLLLAGCGGSGGGDGSESSNSGEVQVAMTDAEGDFLRYELDVTGLRLERASGATVNALPATARIDFADYVEVSELLTSQSVPAGTYVGAEITLDYADAAITVQADDGSGIPAEAETTEGDPVGEITVDLELNGDSRFVVAPGSPAYVELDFDLDASNDIAIDGDTATVTVTPTLVATTSVDQDESLRLRGGLDDVDEADDRFTLDLRPFRLRRERLTEVPVNVDADTVYEIDGEMYSGSEGLAELAALGDAAVIAYGRFPGDGSGYVAEEVLAGSGVASGERDIARGVVTARSGDTLTVRGASVETAARTFLFNDDVAVELANGTTVTRRGDAEGTYTIGDVSVGQAVTVVGELGDNGVLDATDGHVRMRTTRVAAQVVTAGPLVVDVERINGRRASLFDFSGTGTDAGTDADPNAYQIDTGSLSLEGIDDADPVQARGFVRPFGTAPEDFAATSVVDASDGRALLVVGYGAGGSTMAVSSIDASGIQLDLADAGERQALVQAGITTDLSTLPAAPFLQPFDNGTGVFALAQGGSVGVYTDFDAFRTALADALDAGAAVYTVHARGDYDEGGNTLTTASLRVRLAP